MSSSTSIELWKILIDERVFSESILPFSTLSKVELESLIRYLIDYHGGGISEHATFDDLFAYVPAVFQKVSGNVEHRLENLEATW